MELMIGQLLGFVFRWIHIFAGVVWIGLLYYFNFVQGEYFKETSAEGKSAAISKLVPRALKWFRYAALFTFLSGVILAAYMGNTVNFYITVGMLLGTLMFLNVWLIIWPNQRIVIASNDQVAGGGVALPEAAAAAAKAALASRTNTLFSLPMLFFMGASAHLSGTGSLPLNLDAGSTLQGVSMLAIILVVLIIAGLEGNSIKGKMGPMASVTGVIHCGVGLTAVLLVVMQYL
jgi:uncharacterized membrane protein